MQEWTTFGKVLIGLGLGIVVLGIVVILADRLPGVGQLFSWLGKLPGDVSIKRENYSFYFPITTSVLLSVVLSLLFFLVGWLFRR